MTKTKLFSALVIAGTCTFGAQAALAYNAGDFFVRGDIAKSDTDDSHVEDENGFMGSVGYLFHDKLGVALSSSEKFEHDFSTNGSEGTFEQRPINLTLQYYPLGGTGSRVQPYAGAGVNYTKFSGEDLGNGMSTSMDDSWGAVGELGVDLFVTDNLAFNGFASYTDVDADIDINGASAGTVSLDPVTVGGGLSYRF
ncbi:outer membrane protein [Chromohalobacter marismortui]|uniref:Outer membrane protein n=1 Tax=Chromohalobacter marismortui TaxID=42055 RepID=A0A4R7NVJ7_9GAMM|nr:MULTISPECIES: OmpW family outer membrane protein [Chromohalobacter]MCI0510664.1 outer membrane beta-barrel protein [Chromohalobacter sp.]MCI0592157.1 outer membrane beta-barrel protein [Chromohalobacter sp.]TDU24759.1 outer membrane protein [Chromohalobacter marismortui]